VADWVTISSLATAGGTLILALATFSSVKSANRSARVAERSLLAGLRPVLIPSRTEDPEQLVRFGDGHMFTIPRMGAMSTCPPTETSTSASRYGMAGQDWPSSMGGGPWRSDGGTFSDAPNIDEFRRQQRDIYIPAGEPGFWQGAIREQSDPDRESVRRSVESGGRLAVDVLYGDYEGGQRTIARFGLSIGSAGEGPSNAPEPADDGCYVFRAEVVRYFNVDGADPR
jgi:hypothetical protein